MSRKGMKLKISFDEISRDNKDSCISGIKKVLQPKVKNQGSRTYILESNK